MVHKVHTSTYNQSDETLSHMDILQSKVFCDILLTAMSKSFIQHNNLRITKLEKCTTMTQGLFLAIIR